MPILFLTWLEKVAKSKLPVHHTVKISHTLLPIELDLARSLASKAAKQQAAAAHDYYSAFSRLQSWTVALISCRILRWYE